MEKISPSELVSNSYISNHNKMRCPCQPKFKVSFYLYFCCFWINVTQINFENIKRKIQRITSDSCFQLKLWFNAVDARVPSIPWLNFPFNIISKYAKGKSLKLSLNLYKGQMWSKVIYLWTDSWMKVSTSGKVPLGYWMYSTCSWPLNSGYLLLN